MVLHIRKALKVRVRRIVGSMKDRVAIGQLKLRGDRRHTALQVSVILATSHKEALPGDELVGLLLQAGTGSRMRISHCINLLMDRLIKTKSWVVAFKCLTLIHKAVHHGGFIYQDQLSFHPKNGGKNYLNLSGFRDKSSPLAWEASSWVRWYANFLEALMEASKCSYGFLDPKLASVNKVSGLQNSELMAIVLSLSVLWHEICSCPMENTTAATHSLIRDALRLVVADCITAQNQLRMHIKEMCQRLNYLTTSQMSDFLHVCETLTLESTSLRQFADLAYALNVLRPHQCLDGLLFTDYEFMHMKAALTTLRDSNKTLVKIPSERKELRNGSRASFKLLPPSNWTRPTRSQILPQLTSVSTS